ncbi:MAG: HAD hydrolase-like protein, partial [Phycisphaerales bacterium]|nr:HAD hydrolase-like protein [Phycisphaerales bacterium]
ASPRASTIIGDTPHDITCARAHGMRALAVTTGMYTRAQLGEADLVVDALDDATEIIEWLLR